MSDIARKYPKREVEDRAQRSFVMFDSTLLGQLQPLELVTYLQIKRRAGNTKDGECWESIEHMAEETSMSTGSIKRSIRSLLQKNLIVKTKRKGGTDIYTLTPPEEWRFERSIKQVSSSTEHGSHRSTEHSQISTEHGSVRSTEHGSHRSTNKIPLLTRSLNLDPERDLEKSKKISDRGEGAREKKTAPLIPTPAEGELDPRLPDSESTRHPSPQAKPSLGWQASPKTPVEGQDAHGGCRNSSDNFSIDTSKDIFGNPRGNDRAKDLAKRASWFDLGMANNRWADFSDFQSFQQYATKWVENRPQLTEVGGRVLDNPNAYLTALLSRTACCSDDDSADLICWRNWQLEKQVYSPLFVADAVAPEVSSSSAEMLRAKLIAAKIEIEKQRLKLQSDIRSRFDPSEYLLSKNEIQESRSDSAICRS